MRVLILVLAFTVPSVAQRFGDDNQSGDWLPVPDGYIWPEATPNAPKLETKLMEFTKLPEAQQEIILRYWPENSKPLKVSIAEVDLNSDGKAELLVQIPAYSGTGGSFYEMFTLSNDNKYVGIGGIQGWGFQFLVRKNGWLQIEGMSRAGGGSYTRFLMTFSGKGYLVTRNEGHDFNTGKVTIRKSIVQLPEAPQPSDNHKPDPE